jgi:hypothetical protein
MFSNRMTRGRFRRTRHPILAHDEDELGTSLVTSLLAQEQFGGLRQRAIIG